MPDPITAAVALSVGSSIASNAQKKGGAEDAAAIQQQGERESTAARKYMFDVSQSLLQPYAQAGVPAIHGMTDIAGGVTTPNPEYQSMVSEAMKSIAGNNMATGGVRGGNTAGIMSEYTPGLMKSLTDQRFGRLGGLAEGGVRSGIGLGNTATQVSEGNIQSDTNQGQQAQTLANVTNRLDEQNSMLLPQALAIYLGNHPLKTT
jgi:hypothetical protein